MSSILSKLVTRPQSTSSFPNLLVKNRKISFFNQFDKQKRSKILSESGLKPKNTGTELKLRNKNGLHFVFIEGEAATGKSTVCKTLKDNGFQVRFEQFVELCNQNRMYRADGSIIPIKWINSIFSTIEDYARKEGTETHKGNTVFFDRSLLSPYIYSRGSLNNLFACDAMNEIRHTYNCSIVLCKTPHETVRKRLWERYESGSEEEKRVRESLGELDDSYIDLISGRYQELEGEGWFDASLNTGGSLQDATTDLLEMLGVTPTKG